MKRLRIGHWLGSWIYFVSIILLLGTLVVAFLHLVVGMIIIESPNPRYLLSVGVYNGFLYSGVWAGGLAIVLCFVRGHRENKRLAATRQGKLTP